MCVQSRMLTVDTDHRGIYLSRVAEACGFSRTGCLRNLDDVDRWCVALWEKAAGPRFYVLKVAAENLPRSMPPRDAIYIKIRFQTHLGLP